MGMPKLRSGVLGAAIQRWTAAFYGHAKAGENLDRLYV